LAKLLLSAFRIIRVAIYNLAECALKPAKLQIQYLMKFSLKKFNLSLVNLLPFASALLIWRKLQQQESVKGEKIDDRWTVIDNSNQYLQVGCHKILHSEIQAVAKQLGY